MSEARDEFAARLNGRKYGDEMSRAEDQEARRARLLVVFGASDDLTELRGIIHDEAGAYLGAEHKVIQDDGQWAVANDDSDCEKCNKRIQKMPGVFIKAEWAPEDAELSWRIKANVPHATFMIAEEGEPFCQGVVIDEADMLAAIAGVPA